MVREIPLTKGMVAFVDDADVDLVWGYSWRAMRKAQGLTHYAVATVQDGGVSRFIHMHRLITDAPAGTEVDHINRNGLDNRRSNLRFATRSENSRNRTYKRTRPGYRGAYPKQGRWCSSIMVDGRLVSLGYFDTEVEAAIAYDLGVRRHYGAFGMLNFSVSRDWILPYEVEIPPADRLTKKAVRR